MDSIATTSRAGHGVCFQPVVSPLLTPGRAAEIMLLRSGVPSRRIGVVGEISPSLGHGLNADEHTVVVEVRLDALEFIADEEPSRVALSSFPTIDRDINLVVDEAVSWGDIVAAVESTGCRELEAIRLGEIWRDADRLGQGKKSVVVSLRLRSPETTLSAEQANALVAAMVEACTSRVGASLRA